MDFLRRRVSILVTFPFPESQTGYNSQPLATLRPENNLPREEICWIQEENVALEEENFDQGGRLYV